MVAAAPNKVENSWAEFWHSRQMRRFRRNRLAVVGLVLVVLFTLVAIFAPLIAPPPKFGNNCLRDLGGTQPSEVYNPTGSVFWRAIFAAPQSCYQIARVNFVPKPSPPMVAISTPDGDVKPIFGTSSGYDVFYGLVWGTRTAFKLALVVVAVNVLLGLFAGGVSGYFGGWLDNLIQRFIDVIFAFPGLVLIIVITTILGPSLQNVILAFVITGWAGYARVLRGEVLRVRALEFVDGARALGASDWRIIFRHVIPNALTAITVIAVLDMGAIPLSVAALSFLGIGIPVGYADWGQLINAARAWLQGPPGEPWAYWYVSFFPAIVIIAFGLGWNLLGDALRDALDPRDKS